MAKAAVTARALVIARAAMSAKTVVTARATAIHVSPILGAVSLPAAAAALLATALAALALSAPAVVRAEGALPPPVASYRIVVRYDPVTHEAQGREQVTWVNTSSEPVPDLQFHLYLNAFRNLESTFMREQEEREALARRLAGAWGWTDVTRLTLADGTDLTRAVHFIAPDDGNTHDRTVAAVALPVPVRPGDTLRFTLDFHARFPRAVRRTGWARDFIMGAQWFPKLGVFQPAGWNGRDRGGWNCHQFHARSEFFADFGDYDVAITLPRGWTLGATGHRVATRANRDGTVTERFVQRGVHDFAWTASPRFQVHERVFRAATEVPDAELRAVARELGRSVEAVRLPDVRVTFLGFPAEYGAAERNFAAAFAAIKYFGLWYGPYPYDQLTVVAPPRDAASGGMEYPTLITGGSSFLNGPEYGSVEGVVVHEFGHQYWYGLVASNEFEESWLDEGFNSYSTARVMGRCFPPAVIARRWGDFRYPGVAWHTLALPWGLFRLTPPKAWERLDLPLFGVFGRRSTASDLARRRQSYLERPASDDVVRRAWEYEASEVYSVNSYSRPATLLATLERMVGAPLWARVMRTYAEEFRFRHPTTRDFLNTLNSVTGRDWRWFFDQFVWGHRRLDYAVARISSEEIKPEPGVYDTDSGRVTIEAEDLRRAERAREKQRVRVERAAKAKGIRADSARRIARATVETGPKGYRSEVVVRRLGDAVVPVALTVYFSDRTTAHESWDGRYQWARFRYTGPARIDSALVDPQGALLLDTDRLNNSRTAGADHRPARRWTVHWLLWVQSFLQLAGWLA